MMLKKIAGRIADWILETDAFQAKLEDGVADALRDFEKLESRVDDIEGDVEGKLDQYGVEDLLDEKLNDLDLETMDAFLDLQKRVSVLEDADDDDEGDEEKTDDAILASAAKLQACDALRSAIEALQRAKDSLAA